MTIATVVESKFNQLAEVGPWPNKVFTNYRPSRIDISLRFPDSEDI